LSRSAGVSIVVLLLATACGGASPASPGGSPDAGTAPELDGASLPDAIDTDDATLLASSEAQLAVRRHLSDEVDLAAILGEDGPEVVADIEAAEIAYGEEAIAEFVEEMSIDLEAMDGRSRAVAAAAPHPPPAREESLGWSGSMFGNTAFLTSTWMGFAPQGVHNLADNDTFQTQTLTKDPKTHEADIGNLHERLVLTEKITIGAGQGRLVFEVVLTSTAVMTNRATGAEVARRFSSDTGRFEVNACPNAQGVAEGHYTIVDQADVTTPGQASDGWVASTVATFRILNGEDAHLIQTEVEVGVAAGAHGTRAGTGEAFDWDASGAYSIVLPARGATEYRDVTDHTSRNATPANTAQLGSLVAMANHYLAEAAKEAEKFWRSGKCIEMETDDDSRTVKPGEEIEITSEPIGRFDEEPIDAPVKASFSGTKSLEPTDSDVDPPATFTFVAGSEEGDRGTIQLEQTGRRGIGKKTVVFTVGGNDYRVNGTMPGMGGLSGTKCDGIGGAWQLTWSGPSLTGLTTFTLPDDGSTAPAESLIDIGEGEGSAHWDMDGTASVTLPEDGPPILHFDLGQGKVTVSAFGQSHTSDTTGVPADFELEQGDFCQ
jgi:hypothetical protein